MARHALTLASITLLATACAEHGASAPRTAAGATSLESGVTNKKAAKRAAEKKASAQAEAYAEAASELADGTTEAAPGPVGAARKVGDFHVYQYSGTFSKVPITLTEQVVAKEDGHVLVVDFVLEEGDRMSALRVRMLPTEEVVRVSRITSDGETDAAIADYDALMKKTAFVPDSNDAALGTEHTACLIGSEQVDCDVSTYGVTVGKKQAKLSITRSAKVPGRDIGGDVVSSSGKILYSAHLVERGNQPPVVETLAKADTHFVPMGP
jgi:hypothetical protein